MSGNVCLRGLENVIEGRGNVYRKKKHKRFKLKWVNGEDAQVFLHSKLRGTTSMLRSLLPRNLKVLSACADKKNK